MPTFAEDNQANLCLYCTQIIVPNHIWLGVTFVYVMSLQTWAKAGSESIIYLNIVQYKIQCTAGLLSCILNI